MLKKFAAFAGAFTGGVTGGVLAMAMYCFFFPAAHGMRMRIWS